jgi:hypothetical protein
MKDKPSSYQHVIKKQEHEEHIKSMNDNIKSLNYLSYHYMVMNNINNIGLYLYLRLDKR